MISHVLTLAVRLDRPVPEADALPLARAWAHHASLIGGMCSHGPDGAFRVQGAVTPDTELAEQGPGWLIARAGDALRAVLAPTGLTITAWDAAEVHSDEEVKRRLAATAMPPLVNAEQFAGILGLRSRQRIYQLESDRKAGKDRTNFPAPILDGYWLRSMAEQYAKTRKGDASAKQIGRVLSTAEAIRESIDAGHWGSGAPDVELLTGRYGLNETQAKHVMDLLGQSGHIIMGAEGHPTLKGAKE